MSAAAGLMALATAQYGSTKKQPAATQEQEQEPPTPKPGDAVRMGIISLRVKR